MNAVNQTFGPISFDRDLLDILRKERPSVERLFITLARYGFTRPIDVRQPDGTYVFWDPGAMKWGMRSLSKAANLSINTVRSGLNRLKSLGLIRLCVNKLGTVTQVLNFFRLRKQNPQIGVNAPFSKAPEAAYLTRRSDARCATNDPYNRSSNIVERSIQSSVNVRVVAEVKILEREETIPSKSVIDSILGVLSPGLRAKMGYAQ